MEQHPVPQQISSYQFRLVGDMTLKQFFQVASGVGISLLFYASTLHPAIKWPLIIFFTALGAALAFLPFQERPLETWIISFFKSIYSPTIYYWQASKQKPVFFRADANPIPLTPVPSLYKNKAPDFSLDEAEKLFLKNINNLSSPPLNIPKTPPVALFQQGFKPTFVVEETQSKKTEVLPNVQAGQVSQVFPQQPNQLKSVAAQFSPGASPPNPPEQPNIITGQVLDENGKIVEGAILEIRDIQGRPVRALKTNKVGHFLIATPLAMGKYDLLAEKDGLEFEPLSFEAMGMIIPPIAVQAKAKEVNIPVTNAAIIQ